MPVRPTATTDLIGLWADYSSVPDRGITDIGVEVAGATVVVFMAVPASATATVSDAAGLAVAVTAHAALLGVEDSAVVRAIAPAPAVDFMAVADSTAAVEDTAAEDTDKSSSVVALSESENQQIQKGWQQMLPAFFMHDEPDTSLIRLLP
jgi:hypothetical protein